MVYCIISCKVLFPTSFDGAWPGSRNRQNKFCVWSKVFDTLQYDILIANPENYGIPGLSFN